MSSPISATLQQAIACHQRGALAEAELLYREILAQAPDHFDALHLLGVLQTQTGNHEQATLLIRRAIALNPDHAAAHSNLGLALHQCRQLTEALESFDRALAHNPAHAAALYNRGNVLRELKRPAEALDSYDRALALKPDHADALCNRGSALRELKRPGDALASYDRALALKPDDVDALYNRGNALLELDRPAEALASYDGALSRKPNDADAWFNRGNALLRLERYDDALASYDRALRLQPDSIEALNNRGLALMALKRSADALASYAQALDVRPDNPEVLNNRGNALVALKQYPDALANYDRAVVLKPDYADALNNRGNVLRELKRPMDALDSYERALAIRPDYVDALNNRGAALRDLDRRADALASYDRALAIRPDDVHTLYNRGNALQDAHRHAEAAQSFARLLALAPDYDYALGSLIECRLHCCDWTTLAPDIAQLIPRVEAGARAVGPFAFLAMTSSVAAQLQCARTFVADKFPPATTPLWVGERYHHDRIRIAYLSADFREHPLTHLTTELFEQHDRRRFETIGVSFGPDERSELRARLERAFDRFIDVRDQSDLAAANLLRTLEVDIAVDLTGFTRGTRAGVLALRPAPVQVSYLGFPGTMGASYIDYILADRFAVPEAQRLHYAEQVVYLPDTFQANNRARPIASRIPSRTEVGLPEQGFVFCSFNTNYKINPGMFDIWMRLLIEIEPSVLWLVGGNSAVEANLRTEAKRRGVEPDRLVFAARIPYAEHLARYRLADLFLDTLPFNAGTTASDALWAGLPVLTCSGEAFAARMAGSLLHAVGLPELVTDSFDGYEALALKLATGAELLAEMKQRLARNRDRFPLFDTDRFRRHIEAAYVNMWERAQRGEAPAALAIKSSA
jgi:predicted O-linked N-acetylglucosamine transferase (SPINDLY family)